MIEDEEKYALYFKNEKFKSFSDKQKQLLVSAINLFSKNGFSQTSTASIARNAQVSEGLLFKTFGNKQQLLDDILIPLISAVKLPTKESAYDNNKNLSLYTFVNNYYRERINLVNQNEASMRIFLRESINNPALLKSYKQYLPENYNDKINSVFEFLKEKKIIADWDSKYLFRTLNSVLINYLLRNYLFNLKLDPERIDYTIKATTKALVP